MSRTGFLDGVEIASSDGHTDTAGLVPTRSGIAGGAARVELDATASPGRRPPPSVSLATVTLETVDLGAADSAAVATHEDAFIARFSRGRRRSGRFAGVRTPLLTCLDGSWSFVRGRSERTYKQEVVGSSPAAPTNEEAGQAASGVEWQRSAAR